MLDLIFTEGPEYFFLLCYCTFYLYASVLVLLFAALTVKPALKAFI